MFKITVSIKVKRCSGRYNHQCDVSVYYRLVLILTKVDDLINDSNRKDDRFNSFVCNLLEVNTQIFVFLKDQLLVFKKVYVEIFSKNVSLIYCCILF